MCMTGSAPTGYNQGLWNRNGLAAIADKASGYQISGVPVTNTGAQTLGG